MKWTPKKNPPKNYMAWHAWFAWHPIKINDSWHWLETIVRRADQNYEFTDRLFCIPDFQYKESTLDVLKDPNPDWQYHGD